jgi:hypothetical protein
MEIKSERKSQKGTTLKRTEAKKIFAWLENWNLCNYGSSKNFSIDGK